jgi:ABC-type transporter Mla subunit MlaD
MSRKGIWISIVLLAAAAAALIWIVAGSRNLSLVILFDDVGSLKTEAPVTWKGFTVGKVTGIRPLVDNQIGVTIELKEDYVPNITRGTEFYLKSAPYAGVLGSSSIEIVTPASPGSLFSDGEKVQGKRHAIASWIVEGKKWTAEYWRQLSDQAADLVRNLGNSKFRKEAEEALSELSELTRNGARKAKEELEQFRREHEKDLERIRKKLEALRDEMRRQGDDSNARRIDQQIKTLEKGPS